MFFVEKTHDVVRLLEHLIQVQAFDGVGVKDTEGIGTCSRLWDLLGRSSVMLDWRLTLRINLIILLEHQRLLKWKLSLNGSLVQLLRRGGLVLFEIGFY